MNKIVMADALVGNDYSFYLCRALEQAGVEIELVVTEDRKSSIPGNFRQLNWMPSKDPYLSKLGKTWKYVKYLWRLFSYLKKSKPAAIHFQFFRRPRIEALFLYMLKLLPVKIVYTVHDIFPPETKSIDALFVKSVYRNADRLIVHSNFIKSKIVSLFNLEETKISVVPHGDFDFYLPENSVNQLDAKSGLGYAENDFLFLFFGYIREYKGVDILIEAAAAAIEKNMSIKVLIAGSVFPPALSEKYKLMVEKFPVPQNIKFIPEFIPTEDIAKYFCAADVLVLPYRNIYHSGVLHLAYSFGMPVIATKVGDFPETIEHEKSGYLIEPDNISELSQAMLRAARQSEQIMEMGKYARHLSETKYSWKTAALKTREVYHS